MGANEREIERKYLLSGLPRGVAQYPSAEIDQGYIPGQRVRERVRRIVIGSAVTYTRTIKLGVGIDKWEFEEPTTQLFFDTVWPLTEGHRVRKRRYRVPGHGGFDGEWEVDEFLDRPSFFLAEVELTDPEQRPDPPPEIAAVIVREVTDEPGFSNYRLSR
ncbi:MAG TPA: hypothetical protein VIP11_06995 [Gemmatimonadaceae bacterium]